MAQLEFQGIKAKKFHTFQDLDFNFKPGRHLIIGEDLSTGSSNGSGKSTIMECLTWNIYKKSTRGNDPSTHGNGGCWTKSAFKVDGVQYEIERGLKMPKDGNYVRLFREDIDISARTAPAIEEQIEKLIGIPYDLFISTCIVQQGLPVNFSQFTPSLRKNVFESILGFSVWDSYKAKVDKKLKVVSAEFQIQVDKYTTKEREMVALNSKIETLVEAQVKNDADSTLKLDELKAAIEPLAQDLLQKNDEFGSICRGKDPSHWRSLLAEHRATVHHATLMIKNHESFLKQGLCPTCKTPYTEDKLKTAKKEIEQLKKDQSTANEKTDEYNLICTEIENSSKLVQEVQMKLKLAKRSYSELQEELLKKSDNVDVQGFKDQLESLNAEVNELHQQIAEQEKQKDYYEYLSQTLMPSSQFRTKVLSDYINLVSGIIETVSPILFTGVTVRLGINEKATGIDINVFKGEKPINYQQLSGGEKRRMDVVIILSLQKFLLESSGIKTNLLSFDELFEGLDSAGVDSVINCLEFLFQDDIGLYVISHNSELKSRFDSIIHVQKELGVSRIT